MSYPAWALTSLSASPYRPGRGPALCEYLCQDLPRSSPQAVSGTPWVRVLSSWTRSGSALCLSCEPPAHCLWEWVLPEQFRPSCALGWGPGVCLGCCQPCRPPLSFVPQCSAQCSLFLTRALSCRKACLLAGWPVASPAA